MKKSEGMKDRILVVNVNQEDMMSSRKLVWVFILFFHFALASCAKDLTPQDQEFKKANLPSLQPWGVIYDEKEAEKWREFIRIAAEGEDVEIANKLFSLGDRTEVGAIEQYSLALFELYKRKSLFFVTVLNDYYKGDFKKFLSYWINEAEDVQIEEIKKWGETNSKCELVQNFFKAADSVNSELLAEREKKKAESNKTKSEFQKDVTSIIKWDVKRGGHSGK